MKYLSLFSGVGGFELGIQQAYEICNANRSENGGSQKDTKGDKGQGLQPSEREEASPSKGSISQRNNNFTDERPLCIGFSEIDKYASKVYQHHFPNHKAYGDITTINEKELPDFDLLVGGFPCQSFSIAGKRRGFDDTRGTMFFEIARIIKQKQPRLLLLENVKGLLSHDKGSTFTTIITTLDELGYDCQWQVLNSKNHGVPQNRERVFIIGRLRGTPRPEVFPFGEGNPKNLEQLIGGSQGNRLYSTDGLSVCLASQAGGQGAKTGLYLTDDPEDKINRTVRTSGKSSTSDKHNWDTHLIDGRIRRLTPLECERLQGFPDGWTGVEDMSDTQRYKQMGNAVTVNVIQDIISKLM